MIGRDRELATAEAAFAGAKAKRAPVVVRVAGEPGIGKTRFLAELSQSLEKREWLTVLVSCHMAQRETPFLVSNRLVAAVLDRLGDAASRYTSGLEEGLARFDKAIARAVGREVEAASLDPDTYRAVLTRLFEGIAVDYDIAIFCDDVQWIDEPSEAAIRSLPAIASGPVALVLGERANSNRGLEFDPSLEIGLSALDTERSKALIRSLIPEAQDPLVEALAFQSDGMPIAIVIAAEEYRRQGGSLDEVARSIRSRVGQQIADLSEAHRRFVQLCALIGDPIGYALLHRLYPDETELSALIAALPQFIVTDGADFRFRHALVADAALETIAVPVPLRRKIIDAIRSKVLLDLDDYERVAAQARACGDKQLEFDTYFAIVDAASARQNWSSVVSASERALEIGEPPMERWARFYERYAWALGMYVSEARAIETLKSALPNTASLSEMPGAGGLIATLVRDQSIGDRSSEALKTYERYEPFLTAPSERAILIASTMIAAADQLDEALFDRLRVQFEEVRDAADHNALRIFHLSTAFIRSGAGLHASAREETTKAFGASDHTNQLARDLLAFGTLILDTCEQGCAIDLQRTTDLRRRLRYESTDNFYALAFEAWIRFHRGDWDTAMLLASESAMPTPSLARMASLLAIPAAIGSLTGRSTPFDGEIERVARETAAQNMWYSCLQLAPWWLANHDDSVLDRYLREHMDSDAPVPRYLAISALPISLLIWAVTRDDKGLIEALAGHGGTRDRSRWSRTNWSLTRELARVVLGQSKPDSVADDIDALREMQASFLASYASRIAGITKRSDEEFLERIGLSKPGKQYVLKKGKAARNSALTPRELEVAQLVADGATNKRIAEALFLSERTVESHLANIFAKINATSRAGVLRWVLERSQAYN